MVGQERHTRCSVVSTVSAMMAGGGWGRRHEARTSGAAKRTRSCCGNCLRGSQLTIVLQLVAAGSGMTMVGHTRRILSIFSSSRGVAWGAPVR